MNHGDDWEYGINLPHNPLAVGVARGALRLMLRAHGLGELGGTAELLASELVTNAYVHAPGPSCLRVKRSEKWLRLSVWDTSGEPPRVGAPAAGAEGGRGLGIVAELADQWGHYPMGVSRAGGKLVWCELGGP
ncbi:ATP-binding protein [Streptomyces dioscori]|uniref:ATP-binding protein n=1 Tax=Streptomyces dioscori TaxID=2109333 RepID=A0A2P8PWB4_9ACTN|nr:ATP-binding protein [Streptomyces dioscori]PSM38292.1 ATP-binding protein [Streptomyces dioscori]